MNKKEIEKILNTTGKATFKNAKIFYRPVFYRLNNIKSGYDKKYPYSLEIKGGIRECDSLEDALNYLYKYTNISVEGDIVNMKKSTWHEIIGTLTVIGNTKLAKILAKETLSPMGSTFITDVSLQSGKLGQYINVKINENDYGYVAPKGYPGGIEGLFKAFKIKIGKLHSPGRAYQWLRENAILALKNRKTYKRG